MVLLQLLAHQNLKLISTIEKAAAVLKVMGLSETVALMEASSRLQPSSRSPFYSTSQVWMNLLKRNQHRAMQVLLVEWRIWETENQEHWALHQTTIEVAALVVLQVEMATISIMTKMKWDKISVEILMKRTQVFLCLIYILMHRTQEWIPFQSDLKQVMVEAGKTTIRTITV